MMENYIMFDLCNTFKYFCIWLEPPKCLDTFMWSLGVVVALKIIKCPGHVRSRRTWKVMDGHGRP